MHDGDALRTLMEDSRERKRKNLGASSVNRQSRSRRLLQFDTLPFPMRRLRRSPFPFHLRYFLGQKLRSGKDVITSSDLSVDKNWNYFPMAKRVQSSRGTNNLHRLLRKIPSRFLRREAQQFFHAQMMAGVIL
jgi:hypothetical protein